MLQEAADELDAVDADDLLAMVASVVSVVGAAIDAYAQQHVRSVDGDDALGRWRSGGCSARGHRAPRRA
jgi:hypothetical protein